MSKLPTPVLYLDLDGTVRHGPGELGHHVNGPDDVIVFPEAKEMMRRWKDDGGRIIGVSNQGGIALGHTSAAQVEEAMWRTHELTDHLFDQLAWCSHHPAAGDRAMAKCWCRKPAPGLLIRAVLDLATWHKEAYPVHLAMMVGDRDEDRECARIANIDFADAAEWRARALLAEPRGQRSSHRPHTVGHGPDRLRSWSDPTHGEVRTWS
jgi:D-glycero-D-manno-heptose 1,7-bisphosphate phosphatase